MTNIAKAINSYLKSKDSEEAAFKKIFNDMFPDDDFEGLISRHEPGQANVVEYIDGSSEGTVSLGYYCRMTDAVVCREVLTKVINILDNAKITDKDGLIVDVTAVTTPQFTGTDDKERSIYSCSINADYIRN